MKLRCSYLLLLVLVLPVICLGDTADTISLKIEASRKKLAATEARITRESAGYAERLDSTQKKIAALRTQAATLQRVVDEQTLGYDTLKTRVEKWKAQKHYQNHLLASYVESSAIPRDLLAKENGELVVDYRALQPAIDQLESYLSPRWNDTVAVGDDGVLVDAKVLALGPVEVSVTSGYAGLVSRELSGQPKILDIFDKSQQRELASLLNSGKGNVVFDPTLGNARQLMEAEGSLTSHIEKGGIWAFPIVVFGILSFLIALLKGIQLVRLPAVNFGVMKALEDLKSSGEREADEQLGKLKKISRAQGKLIDIARRYPVSQHRDDLLVAHLTEHRHHTEKYIGVIATSAAIAPLLGLLGTVSGMINTFKMMTIFGSGDASTVSAGISEALVTTELGLVVAIPSLIVSALLTRKTRSYAHKLENFAIQLSKLSIGKKHDTAPLSIAR